MCLCLVVNVCLSTLQDGLGLAVQQGLTAPEDAECLERDGRQPARCHNTHLGGAAAPALDTHAARGPRG